MATKTKFKGSGFRVYNDDCLVRLDKMAKQDVQFDAVVTDPPYNLESIAKRFGKTSIDDENKTGRNAKGRTTPQSRLSRNFMGNSWDNDISFKPETWAKIFAVMKPGAYLLAFGGTRTFHRIACAIEDGGFEIRDCIMWVFGSGLPISHNVEKALKNKGHHKAAKKFKGTGTKLKPAFEPIIVARKPHKGTVADNLLKHGTGGLNIDACRVGKEARWPANLIHDGGTDYREQFRFFYCAKANKTERNGSTHPTVKPQALMQYLIQLVARENAKILDPFAGTGSTLSAGLRINRRVVGIEKEKPYFKDIKNRLAEFRQADSEKGDRQCRKKTSLRRKRRSKRR